MTVLRLLLIKKKKKKVKKQKNPPFLGIACPGMFWFTLLVAFGFVTPLPPLPTPRRLLKIAVVLHPGQSFQLQMLPKSWLAGSPGSKA